MFGSASDSFASKGDKQVYTKVLKNQEVKDTVEDNNTKGKVIIKKLMGKVYIYYNNNITPIILCQTFSGEVNGKHIVHNKFADIVYYVEYNPSVNVYDDFIYYLKKNKYDVFEEKNGSVKMVEKKKYLFALVTIAYENESKKGNEGNNDIRYLVYCENANKKGYILKYNYGLFQDSEAIGIVIVSCGRGITSMVSMFRNCCLLKILSLKRLITTNVTDMSCMFYNCSNLEKLILWETEMNKVYRMYALFRNCFVKKGNIICTGSMLKKIQNENHMPKIIRYISFITGTITGLEFEKEDSHNANYVDVQKYKCTIQNNKILTVETVEERVGGV